MGSAGSSSSPVQGVLHVAPAPPDLMSSVTAFVRRIDPGCGGVVRILPELRASLQVQTADPYWVREQGDDVRWRRVARVSVWGPRHRWGWGYARRDISAYGVGLTMAGLAALTGQAAPALVNEVLALDEVDPSLATALDARPAEAFEAWVARASQALRAALADRPAGADPVAAALPILATSDGDAAARAAAACGLSERHFRRLFRAWHGASPKLYQRLMRVDRKLRELHARPWEPDPWVSDPIAFADEPHLIREFRSLTGLTPRDYARAKATGEATLRSLANVSGSPLAPQD